MFHPGLVRSFEYAVKTQLDEFVRLYGTEPKRLMATIICIYALTSCLRGFCRPGPLSVEIFRFDLGRRACSTGFTAAR